ncbi:alkaline shock response membrane anchor protein AmaP [Mycolicibacterium sp. 3033]|nr:alkaline shock response membrane anchor protein AmaP [Mycolicibacterium aurantiacum]
MTRAAVAFDRVVTLLAGTALVAAGLAAVTWSRGDLGAGRALTTPLAEWTSASWWPWALGGAGIVLILVALRWLAAHRRPAKASRVDVSGDATATADASSVASAAADVLAADPAVTKASGSATRHRGRPVVTVTARVPARSGLSAAIDAADDTARTAATMLGGSVAIRTVLRVDAKAGTVVR